MSTRVRLHSVLKVSMLAAALLAGCSDDNESGKLVSGNVKNVITDAAVASQSFSVKDLEHFSDDPIASGTSDANGNYSFRVDGPQYLVVLFAGQNSPSGLVSVAEGDDDSKDLDDVTTLACAAGVDATVGHPRTPNPVTPAQMNRARIANREAGAAADIAANHPDFTNTDSFNAAVARVRASTDDGDHPPSG